MPVQQHSQLTCSGTPGRLSLPKAYVGTGTWGHAKHTPCLSRQFHDQTLFMEAKKWFSELGQSWP